MLPHENLELLRQRVLQGDPTVTDDELRGALAQIAELRQTSSTAKSAKASKTTTNIDVMGLLRKRVEERKEQSS